MNGTVLKILSHDVRNRIVRFGVSPSLSGVSYSWSIQGGSLISGQSSSAISVKYNCSSLVSITANCRITDRNYPSNTLSLSKRFTWDKCLSGGSLSVKITTPSSSRTLITRSSISYDLIGGGISIPPPEPALPIITLRIDNLSGGSGNLSYRWYSIVNGSSNYLGTTSTNQFIISDDSKILSLCGKTVKFKCEIKDNNSGQVHNITESGTGHTINCN